MCQKDSHGTKNNNCPDGAQLVFWVQRTRKQALTNVCRKDSYGTIIGGLCGMAKILIIEDETAIAELEKDYLELSGFEVTMVSEGKAGLMAALKDDYQLVILDLMLPGMDGFEICRNIRAWYGGRRLYDKAIQPK